MRSSFLLAFGGLLGFSLVAFALASLLGFFVFVFIVFVVLVVIIVGLLAFALALAGCFFGFCCLLDGFSLLLGEDACEETGKYEDKCD